MVALMKSHILGICLALNASAALAQVGNWEFKVITDPMSDARRGIANTTGSTEATIVLKCDSNGPGSIYMSIISNNYLGKGRYGSRNIDFRFDGGPVQSISGYHDGRTANVFDLSPNKPGGKLLTQLSGANEMVVRLSSYEYDTYTTILNVKGADLAIRQVAEACRDTEWL